MTSVASIEYSRAVQRGEEHGVTMNGLMSRWRRLGVLGGGVLISILGAPKLAKAVEPNEQLVSLQPDLIDAEFSQSRAQITWCDVEGNLWLGDVDPDTGMFSPFNGKAELVDPDAMRVGDLAVTFNGPEWVPTDSGDVLVYTKFVPGWPHLQIAGRLAVAEPDENDQWSVRVLDGPTGLSPRLSPYGSEDESDPFPRVTYTDHQGVHFWREIDDASTEAPIPMPNSVKSVRFVQGDRAVVYTMPAENGQSQVFLYGLDTMELEQITFDDGEKDVQTVPWIWQAPEFDNDFVLMTTVDNAEVRIYREIGDNWNLIYTLNLPPDSKIASPEPFVHNGRSYFFTAMTVEPNNFPDSIWLGTIDPDEALFERISDDRVLRARSDPELFITSQGPYVYYNRYNQNVNPDKPFCADCSEGVFRAFTGLPAPE